MNLGCELYSRVVACSARIMEIANNDNLMDLYLFLLYTYIHTNY